MHLSEKFTRQVKIFPFFYSKAQIVFVSLSLRTAIFQYRALCQGTSIPHAAPALSPTPFETLSPPRPWRSLLPGGPGDF